MGVKLIIVLIVASAAILPTLGINEVTLTARGVIAAALTPIDRNNNVNVDIIYQYAQFLKDNNVDGVQLAGTTGEGPDLSVQDKKKMIDTWTKAVRPLNLSIIVQVCGIPLPDAIELAKYAAKAGVDAIMCLPDLYYRAKTPKELVYYLQFIARAAPNIPILYNDLPQYSGVFVDMVEFVQLATRKIPNFKGLETGSLNNALNVRKYLENGQRIFIGDSPYLAPAALMGFDSFINPDVNFLPDLVIEIVRNAKRGNLKKVRSEFQRLRDVRQIIIDQGNSPTNSLSNELASIKAAIVLFTGIDMGNPKAPVRPLSDDQINSLSDALREANVRIYDASK